MENLKELSTAIIKAKIALNEKELYKPSHQGGDHMRREIVQLKQELKDRKRKKQ